MKRDFGALFGQSFDLLVCGGGIYGAWTAYDAALRGLRVAIVEQGDWASATSSASSKLIHGGLRYLETFDFKLVRKALHERQLLLRIAPHRVWPLRFGVPVYADSRNGIWKLEAGLTLYDHLADVPDDAMKHRRFDAIGFAARFPVLHAQALKGGFTYGDAQTDDARLVLELIAGAQAAGAVCVNYCKLTGLLETDGRVSGVTLLDGVGQGSARVMARQIVHAGGQWMASSPPARDWCRMDKGIHLVMPYALDEALLLTAKSDGRVFFMIPWYGRTLLGTTDRDYRGDPDRVAVEPEEMAYLLAEANHYLKRAWTEQDIIGSYAGVRVMKRSDESAASVSRDWELKTAPNGAHYSIGGKLTSAREDAAHIVDAVCAELGVSTPCATRNRLFPWAPEQEYSAWAAAAGVQAGQLGIDPESAGWLMRRHGKRVGEVFRLIADDAHLAERVVAALPFVYADLLWSARDEMVVHLDDLLRRRMPLLILAQLSEAELRRIAETVAATLGWDDAALNREIETCGSAAVLRDRPA
jgi:glycerol-3-phosphate dehydrogenase